MKLLHTADWHLGARLIERDRLAEHAAFFDWLIAVLRSEKIDGLLVSGDIFDAANPPQDAVALYFDFLKRLADLKSVRAIFTGGNHDSATHLNAPRELLRRFDVHVFGNAATANDAAIDLGDVVVGAVPFLRERDLRQSTAGESMSDAQSQIRSAIQSHYEAQYEACRRIAGERPVLAMGHLTVLGAATSDSERDIHIGNLGAVGSEVFEAFDYTALGHLHRPQAVAGLDTIRYSGSPIALSFSEASDSKSVVVVETSAKAVQRIDTLPVPQTRRLVRAAASRDSLEAGLATVPDGSWAEITVKMDVLEADLDRRVRDLAAGRFEVLKVLAELPATNHVAWEHNGPALNELQPREVFRELLKERGGEYNEFITVFDELLALHEEKQLA